VSTDEIYGETLQLEPFKENELPNPTNPYAATKVGAEYIVHSYYHCFELPIIIVRGNNVYGPRQYPEKMIPKFVTALLHDKPCTIAGNGLMQRNFIYVEDVCYGLVAVIEKGKIDNIYNIGTSDEKSVLDIARIMISIMKGSDVDTDKYLQFVKDRYYNDFRYSINADKIRSLGWKQKMTFSEGLSKTIQFYTENVSLYDTTNS
jgi:dTDP-D-glucose 4,6-dehydratase